MGVFVDMCMLQGEINSGKFLVIRRMNLLIPMWLRCSYCLEMQCDLFRNISIIFIARICSHLRNESHLNMRYINGINLIINKGFSTEIGFYLICTKFSFN